MIVSLEYIWLQSTGGFLMREVNTEEEAFAEMRRFLAVNNIPSDTTGVHWSDEKRCENLGIPMHKRVVMYQSGYTPSHAQGYPDPCFGIYYGTDRPRYEHLGSYEEYGLSVKINTYTGKPVLKRGEPVLISDYYSDGCEWYTPLARYLEDLKKRTGGDG